MRGVLTKLSLENIQEILWCYERGATVSKLAEWFRTSHYRITGILFDHGLVSDPKKLRPKLNIQLMENNEKINQGMSYADYLKKHGMTKKDLEKSWPDYKDVEKMRGDII